MYCRGRLSDASGFPQKRGLALICFDEMHLGHAEDAKDQARQSRSASEIDQDPGRGIDVPNELATVQNMPAPHVRQARCADEIDPPVPTAKEVDIGLESPQRFT